MRYLCIAQDTHFARTRQFLLADKVVACHTGAMTKKAMLTYLQRRVHPTLIAAVLTLEILGLLVVMVVAWQLQLRETSTAPSSFPQAMSRPTRPAPTVPPTTTFTPTPSPSVHTFTSPDLGISFSYVSDIYLGPAASGLQDFFAREIGNTVYLYGFRDHPFEGTDAAFLQMIGINGAKSVEVFPKDPTITLQEAIKRRFLPGYIGSDCFVSSTPHYGHPRLDETYETTLIDHSNSFHTLDELDALVARCPNPKYVTAYGVSYFMMNPDHPDTMVFVKDGQDNIGSGIKGYTWDETLKIF